MRLFVSILCLTLGLTSVQRADDLEAPAQDLGPDTNPSQELRSVPSLGHIEGLEVMLPAPIGGEYFKLYCRILSLSPTEREVAMTFYGSYVSDWKRVIEESVSELRTQAKKAANYDDLSAQLFALEFMLEIRTAMLNEFKSVDARFLLEMESLIDEERQAALDWVKASRTRASSNFIESPLPFVAMDLVDFLFTVCEGAENIPAEALPVIQAYDRQGAPVFGARAANRPDQILEGTKLSLIALATDARDPESPERSARIDELLQTRSEVVEAMHRADRRVQDLNRSFFRQMAGSLPAETAQTFERLVRGKAYQRIYDDPFDPRPVLQDVAERVEMSIEEQAQFDAIGELRTQQYEAVCLQMERRFREWKSSVEPRTHGKYVDPRPYRDEMLELEENRRRYATTCIDLLKELFGIDRLQASPIFIEYEARRAKLHDLPWTVPG